MTVNIAGTAIDGIKLITSERFGDQRGWFEETFRTEWASPIDLNGAFVQDNQAFSAELGVLRGLHFQFPNPQAKLVRVVRGAILDVAVDIRRASPTFGQHIAIELSAENGKQVFVPHGFAHGYVTLCQGVIVTYKVDAYYDAGAERGLLWNDPSLTIDWRLQGSVNLSEKDQCWPKLSELGSPF